MESDFHTLRLEDFARLFGADVSRISHSTRSIISAHDFRYRKINKEERDQLILGILKKLDANGFTLSGEKDRWDKGWTENLEEFKNSNYDPSALVPKYHEPNRPTRLFREYAKPIDPGFQTNYARVFLSWLFEAYLKDVDSVYEFGCGTGLNLVWLAELYPEKELYGLDWVSASRDIVELLAKHRGYKMHGHVFDMFSPDKNFSLRANSAVFTMGALELLDTKYERFLEFVLGQSPKIVVDVNSILELYDQDNLLDYLAYRYELKRKYLNGYFARLKELETEGKIEIIKMQRVFFGSLYHDGYSYTAWRPRSNTS